MRRVMLIDVGNRSVKAVLVRSGEFDTRWSFDTSKDPKGAVAGLLEAEPEEIAYSSVVPVWTSVLRSITQKGWTGRMLEAGSGSDLPFGLSVEEPAGIGSDRLCAALGAWAEGSREAVIVDAGTAVTVDLLSDGSFQGGSIFPGYRLLAGSLHGGTALLPLIDSGEERVELPGRKTIDAMRSGIFWGFIGAVRELVSRMLPPGGDLWVTGGGGRILSPYLGNKARFEGDLVLKGLLRLLEPDER